MNSQSEEKPTSFTASTNPVKHLLASSDFQPASRFLTAAEVDHFVSIYDIESPEALGILRTENEAISLLLHSEDVRNVGGNLDEPATLLHPQQTLGVVNKDGMLELFPSPFSIGGSTDDKDPASLKARMKKRSRKAAATVKILRPDGKNTMVPLLDASFESNELVLAWAEGAVNIVFERLKWREEGSRRFLLSGVKEILKAKSSTGVGAVTMNGVKDLGKSYVDESQAVVSDSLNIEGEPMNGVEADIINISSDVESEAEERSESSEGESAELEPEKAGPDDHDLEMPEAGADEFDTSSESGDDQGAKGHGRENDAEPSFGELIAANAPIDVQNPACHWALSSHSHSGPMTPVYLRHAFTLETLGPSERPSNVSSRPWRPLSCID